MAHGPLYRVAFRRRREGKTDYRTRLALLKSGESRVVVRNTNRNVIVQFVNYDEKGDVVVATAEARELLEMGYKSAGNNTPSAYLPGRLAATRAKEAGVEAGVLDIGRANPQKGGVLFGALKGVIDGGIAVPAGKDVFPDEGRIRAEHLNAEKAAAFAASYEKIVGKPLPPKAEKPKAKGKGDAGKGAPAKGGDAKSAGGKPKGDAKPAGDKPAKEKKAKSPE
jgi:large subunit ribosomal protein L18